MAKTEQVLCLEPQHELKFKGKGRPPPGKRLSSRFPPPGWSPLGAAGGSGAALCRSCSLPGRARLQRQPFSGGRRRGGLAGAKRPSPGEPAERCLGSSPASLLHRPSFGRSAGGRGDPGTGRRLRLLGPGCCLGRMGSGRGGEASRIQPVRGPRPGSLEMVGGGRLGGSLRRAGTRLPPLPSRGASRPRLT